MKLKNLIKCENVESNAYPYIDSKCSALYSKTQRAKIPLTEQKRKRKEKPNVDSVVCKMNGNSSKASILNVLWVWIFGERWKKRSMTMQVEQQKVGFIPKKNFFRPTKITFLRVNYIERSWSLYAFLAFGTIYFMWFTRHEWRRLLCPMHTNTTQWTSHAHFCLFCLKCH